MRKFINFYKKFLNLTINWFDEDANGVFKIKVKELDIDTRKKLYREVSINQERLKETKK